MPQMLLPIFPGGLTLVNPQVGFEKREGKVYYFNGQFCFHIHEEEDVKSFRFVTSQMVVSRNGLFLTCRLLRGLAMLCKRTLRMVRQAMRCRCQSWPAASRPGRPPAPIPSRPCAAP